ncbi:Protein of unknown function [Pyronema omphalodes CBS 100304]|uniref:Uncharacterized protein n=1 Tax=Pyronema omphalodes (strain CBS 100304) TaxID=1076935 RepID=U4LES6_PYROM|nr:Protein of unknown function [Pyronema omphalodes CBS 100304]
MIKPSGAGAQCARTSEPTNHQMMAREVVVAMKRGETEDSQIAYLYAHFSEIFTFLFNLLITSLLFMFLFERLLHLVKSSIVFVFSKSCAIRITQQSVPLKAFLSSVPTLSPSLKLRSPMRARFMNPSDSPCPARLFNPFNPYHR